MKRLLLPALLLILLAGCGGPQEGDKYKFNNIDQTVTVVSTGEYEHLAGVMRNMYEMQNEDTGSGDSPNNRTIVINDDLDSLVKEHAGKQAALISWDDSRDFNYQPTAYITNLRIVTTEELELAFTKVTE